MRVGYLLALFSFGLAYRPVYNQNQLIRRHGIPSGQEQGPNNNKMILCNSTNDQSDYDMPLHIGTIFIMIAVSSIGCGITASANFSRIPKVVIDVGRHFGSGVILSTAFVHMLTGAYAYLTNPCAPLPLQNYPAMAPLIALVAGLLMHLIEFLAMAKFAPLSDHSSTIATPNDLGLHDEKLEPHSHAHFNLNTDSRDLTTYILEMGILSHSIFIGITLGVTSGKGFLSLLIAIIFHQFFEGIGLGARISELKFDHWRKPLLMVLMFSVTTAIGIVIGIAIRTVYSTSSPLSLTIQGIFDAISAGILIYTGLVELVGRELSLHSEFGAQPWSIRILYLSALYLGVASMAIIGVWA